MPLPGARAVKARWILVSLILAVSGIESRGAPDRTWLSGGGVVLTQATPARVLLEGDEASLAGEAQAWARWARHSGAPACRLRLVCPPAGASAAPCELDVTSCVPDPLRGDLGRTFSQPGPNCFAAALHGAGAVPGYRGIDVSEMKSHARLFCREVQEPQPMDLGVYVSPGFTDLYAESTVWVHAFLWVTPEVVFEKQGVDYWGATPVGFREFRHVDYRVRASPECRRYSQNLSDCANRLIYLRCSPPRLATAAPELKTLLGRLETLLAQLIDQQIISVPLKQEAEITLKTAQALLDSSAWRTAPDHAYVQTRLESFRRQLLFLKSPAPIEKVHRTF